MLAVQVTTISNCASRSGSSLSVIAPAPLTEEVAYYLAGAILEETEEGTVEDSFQAGTDWVRVGALAQGGDLADMGLNNNQRESLVRNTWGLFSPDNSLFTVVVISQTIKEGPSAVGIWNAADDIVRAMSTRVAARRRRR